MKRDKLAQLLVDMQQFNNRELLPDSHIGFLSTEEVVNIINDHLDVMIDAVHGKITHEQAREQLGHTLLEKS